MLDIFCNLHLFNYDVTIQNALKVNSVLSSTNGVPDKYMSEYEINKY